MPPAMRGGQGRGLQATTPQLPRVEAGEPEEVGEEPRRNSPPPLPPLPPLQPAGYWRRAERAPTLYATQGQGSPPPPPKRAAAPG